MRKIFSLLLLLTLCCTALFAAEKQDEVRVRNVAELIHALKSNRVIIVDMDIDFGDQLAQFHSFNPQRLPELSSYEVMEKHDQYTDKIFVADNYDGYGLFLTGFKNLTIKSDNPTGMRMLMRVRPRYAYVLSFIGCSDITIDGLVMGHTDEGYCEGGVLEFYDCKNVNVSNCDLYGCGIEGICFRKSHDLVMTNSIIRDCSYQIMTIRESYNCLFDRCSFFRNRQFSLLDLIDVKDLTFRGCLITHNEGTLFNIQDGSGILFEDCNMMHPMDQVGDPGTTKFKNCHWSSEYGVKRND